MDIFPFIKLEKNKEHQSQKIVSVPFKLRFCFFMLKSLSSETGSMLTRIQCAQLLKPIRGPREFYFYVKSRSLIAKSQSNPKTSRAYIDFQEHFFRIQDIQFTCQGGGGDVITLFILLRAHE